MTAGRFGGDGLSGATDALVRRPANVDVIPDQCTRRDPLEHGLAGVTGIDGKICRIAHGGGQREFDWLVIGRVCGRDIAHNERLPGPA